MKQLALAALILFMSTSLFAQGVPDITNINPKSGT